MAINYTPIFHRRTLMPLREVKQLISKYINNLKIMITTIKDLKDFKLEINLKIATLNSNELSRNWIKSNYRTTTIESDSDYIIKEEEILVKVMQGLYVILPLATEPNYIKLFRLNKIFGN